MAVVLHFWRCGGCCGSLLEMLWLWWLTFGDMVWLWWHSFGDVVAVVAHQGDVVAVVTHVCKCCSCFGFLFGDVMGALALF